MLRTKGLGLQVMYLLTPAAYVPPRLNMGTITMETVKKRFARNFFEAARNAMATRKVAGALTDKV